jgi:hypothetical protein
MKAMLKDSISRMTCLKSSIWPGDKALYRIRSERAPGVEVVATNAAVEVLRCRDL